MISELFVGVLGSWLSTMFPDLSEKAHDRIIKLKLRSTVKDFNNNNIIWTEIKPLENLKFNLQGVQAFFNVHTAFIITNGDAEKIQKRLDVIIGRLAVIREKVLGLEHPSTAATYNNIAVAYRNQGEYAKALEWLQKALVIFKKVLGLEHQSTIIIKDNIAIVKTRLNQQTTT